MIDLTIALDAESVKAPEVIEAAEKICTTARAANQHLGVFVPGVADIS